ncbi:hypothetical protein E4U21_007189, partial [Claviceps maximensis]
GIADALDAQTRGTNAAEAEAPTQLLRTARDDLGVDSIFSADYWAPDGTWTYDVGGPDGQIVFSDVADAHPMIRKWRDIVDEQLRAWRVRTTLLDSETGSRLDDMAAGVVAAEPSSLSSGAPRPNQSLDW